MLAHATRHMIEDHMTSEKHTEMIHAQIHKHGDKHVMDLVMASVIVLIIMCAMLTLVILVYFGCISKSFRLIPLRYLCCPCLLLCRRQDDMESSSGSGAPSALMVARGVGSGGSGSGRNAAANRKFTV